MNKLYIRYKHYYSSSLTGRFLFSLCFLILFSCAAQAQDGKVKRSTRIEKIQSKKFYIHTVEAGQTLFAIAKAYALEVNDIVLENPDAIDGIKPGQELKVPFSKSVRNSFSDTPPVESPNPDSHKVEQGQTLYSIAKLYHTTVGELKTLNPDLKEGLKAGQYIKIPAVVVEKGKVTKPVVETIVVSATKEKETPSDPKGKTPKEVKMVLVPADTNFILQKKSQYQVALFAPFNLENAENLDVERIIHDQEQLSSKTDLALQFYQGVKIAMDSIQKSGVLVQLYVYDADEGDSLKVSKILKKPEMAEMNLILGPLTNNCFSWVAKFAKQKNIPIVSPLSQHNKILLNNECVSKLYPSVTTQMEGEADYIVKNYTKENIVLITNGNTKEAQYARIFRSRFAELYRQHLCADSLRVLKGMSGIGETLSSSKVNVLVVPSNSQAYVTDLLRMINTLGEKKKIVVFGMQSWNSFNNLDYDYLNKLSLHFAASGFVDYENDATVRFIRSYRSRYGSEPGQHVYEGFDVGYYYLNALREYGTDFRKKLPQLKWMGIQTAFDLYKTSAESGFENKSLNMVMIQEYKLIRAK